ncbi:serine hydrolase domain-containing protein [Fibrella forsythiae]|uniref:Serine hydrolase n=1 Tax=Fibrella forsythiae TaxID=2817061 RepID=A0ABS3JEK2_9BACT|nr:serine hydrolase [Fibrella forsythiae]MBO0947714.1 serine hydrolase [Fibrella forsythiae]
MHLNRRHFLQQLGVGALSLGAATTGLANSVPGLESLLSPARTVKLPRSIPTAQGVAPTGLLDFANAIEKANLNVHSIMVVRHGQVVGEGWWAPYAPQLKHTLYSLSKAFTSTAVGLAVAEGRLTVEDKVISFFKDQLPATVSENLAAMRVQDLLTMSTGHDKEPTPDMRANGNTNWIKVFLAHPVDHKPGTHFVYNSGATYILSAIVQKLTGQPLITYLQPRLFGPLDIEGADWEVDPNGINTGGWGLRLHTEDIAKFGQLYLQKGTWNGKRILSEAWVAEATTSHIQSAGGKRKAEENDWLQGYGYQFWRCRHDAYRGDGAMGQYCIVMPKEDAVIAITSETGDMQAVMDAVWNHILPAFKATPLPADAAATALTAKKLSSLALTYPVLEATSPLVALISGKTIAFESNSIKATAMTLTFGNDKCQVKFSDDQGNHQLTCGINRWAESESTLSTKPIKLVPTPIPGERKTLIAGTATWQDANTLLMTWRFIETAHYETVTCRFGADAVTVEFESSIAKINKTKDARPVLQGKLQAGALSHKG